MGVFVLQQTKIKAHNSFNDMKIYESYIPIFHLRDSEKASSASLTVKEKL